ncbi:hypothetical protein ACFL43_06965, partial [Thermodesulfobacteriota bacterium]
MGKVHIDDLEPGMVLATDLYGPNDRFLLAADTLLEKKHFQIFKAWGVAEADIQDISQSDVEVHSYARFDQDIIERSQQLVGRRFAAANQEHEAVAELYRLAVLRAAQMLESNPDAADADTEPEQPDLHAHSADALPPIKMTAIIK